MRESFSQQLTMAIKTIKRDTGKPIGIIQDELGYALNKGGRETIKKWRNGDRLPRTMAEKKQLACALIEMSKKSFDRTWLQNFLDSMYYANVDQLCEKLFPDERELTTIPVETVPAPGPLPEGSLLPLFPNPLFVGRDNDLCVLAQEIKLSHKAGIQPTIAIAGIGGIGKTQMAIEFAHRYGRYFPGGVFWLHFADEQSIPSQVAACGGIQGMNLAPGFDELPLNRRVELVKRAWRSPVPRLLIFDECEDELLLAHWRPTFGGCCVILTSRRIEWDLALGVTVFNLSILKRPDSITLLQRFQFYIHPQTANEIAAELGDLPLAIHLASNFLRHYQNEISPDIYLAQIRGMQGSPFITHPSLQGNGTRFSPTQHELHIARTFALSYDRLNSLDSTDAQAIKLLARAACFAPAEPIPRRLLVASMSPADQQVTPIASALNRLTNLGLISHGLNENIQLHRLVVDFVKSMMSDDTAQIAVEEAILAEVIKINGQISPHLFRDCESQLRFIADAALQRDETSAAALYTELGQYLWNDGIYGEGIRYCKKAVELREQILGPDHPDTATSIYYLARNTWGYGDMQSTYPLLVRALEIRQKTLGMDHFFTALSLNSLGIYSLEVLEDLQAARSYLESALAIQEKQFGLWHPATISPLRNLGKLSQASREYEEALYYLERVLDANINNLGEEHCIISLGLNDLGCLYMDMHDYKKAFPFFKQALAIQEKELGPVHANTAETLYFFGEACMAMNRLQLAHRYLRRSLVIRRQLLPRSHPLIGDSAHRLGEVYLIQGLFKQAQTCFQHAYIIRRKALGDNHRSTQDSLDFLKKISQRRLGQAIDPRPWLTSS